MTPFCTALLACVVICWICEIAPGSVLLIAVAASLPLAWNAEPILPPWLRTPETTCPPCEVTLPLVSPETLDATFAPPSCAASFGPPPEPDWPWIWPAVELMLLWTFPAEVLTACVPWLAKSEPVWVACVPASSTALLVLLVAEPCQVVTLPLAVAPAEATRPLAPATAEETVPCALANAPLTVPRCVWPASWTSRLCLPTAWLIACVVRCWACLRRWPSVCSDSLIASLTVLRPSLIDSRRSRARSLASRISSGVIALVEAASLVAALGGEVGAVGGLREVGVRAAVVPAVGLVGGFVRVVLVLAVALVIGPVPGGGVVGVRVSLVAAGA